jgi:hypothetical protein
MKLEVLGLEDSQTKIFSNTPFKFGIVISIPLFLLYCYGLNSMPVLTHPHSIEIVIPALASFLPFYQSYLMTCLDLPPPESSV